MIARRNFAILIIYREPNSDGIIPGELVQAGIGLDFNTPPIDFTQGQFQTTPTNRYFNNITDSLASVFLSSMLFELFQNTSTQMDEPNRLIFVVYDANSVLFQDPRSAGTGSVILSFLRSPQQGPTLTNLEQPVKFQFQANQVSSNQFVSHN